MSEPGRGAYLAAVGQGSVSGQRNTYLYVGCLQPPLT